MAKNLITAIEADYDEYEDEIDERENDRALETNVLMSAYKPPIADPTQIWWPPTLALEIALGAHPIKTICEAHNLSRDQWNELRKNEQFRDEVVAYTDELRKDGMTFKMKARLQSEALLTTAWNMIHDQKGVVPPNVRADLIKFVIRSAGLDGSKEQAAQTGPVGTALQINISL